MSKVHILTLTWNGCDKLTKLKESLMPALEGIEYTWWIKDNASIDNTVEVASQWGDSVKVIEFKNNLQNFSQGCNFLFNEAKPKDDDLILLLNNDVSFGDTTSLKRMIQIIKNDALVGVVGARLLFTGTNNLQHAGVTFKPKYDLPMHFRSGEESDDNAEKNRLFQVVTGAVLLLRADSFKNAFENKSGNKGMDENYHWAFDDVDLCLSIGVNQKKKIVYCGQTKIFHEESASLKKNPANKLFMNHNVTYFKNKWRDKYKMDLDIYTKNLKHNLYK